MRDRVRDAALALFRTEQAADAWLTLRCERLGAVPLELVDEGRGEEVIQLLQQIASEVGPPDTDPWAGLRRLLGPLGGRPPPRR
jgi:hypothetical protein